MTGYWQQQQGRRPTAPRKLNALVAHADAFPPGELEYVNSVLIGDDGELDYGRAASIAFARSQDEDQKVSDSYFQRVTTQLASAQTLDFLSADISDAELARLVAMYEAGNASGYEQGVLDAWPEASECGVKRGVAATLAVVDARHRQFLQDEAEGLARTANWIAREKEDELEHARRVRAKLRERGVLTEDTAPSEKVPAHQVATGRPGPNTMIGEVHARG